MPNPKMDAIQVQDTVVSQKRALSPRLKLFGQRLVQAADRAGTGCDSQQFFSDFPHFMGRSATDKHLCQRFSYLRFIAGVALEDLSVKLPFSISGNFQIFNAPCWGHQIAGIGPITISTAMGSTFSP